MSENGRWFITPLIQTDATSPDGISPPKRPKYTQEVEVGHSENIPEQNESLALLVGEESKLDEIADKPDVDELNEIEARKLLQQINESKEEQEFQPITPGEGNTSEERLNDVISELQEGMFVGDEGVTVAEPSMEVGNKLFLEQQVVLLDYEESTKVARQLFDLLLQPPAPVIPLEQREYLDTISNFVQFVMGEKDLFEPFMKNELSKGPGLKGLMLNFNIMMDYILLHDRMSDADQRVKKFIESYTGMSGAPSILTTFSLFGPTSLAILDGFVKYRCENIGIEDGNYTDGTIEMSWRPDDPERSSMNYHDRLQYWRTEVAGEKVKDVLDEIDDLGRYSEANLEKLAGIMGNEQVLERELDTTGHFLAVLSEQRNYNIHGQGSSRIVTPLALNLSNLVLLDIIGQSNYEDLLLDFLEAQRS